MKLTFVGTGSGKTSLKRNHSSILLDNGEHKSLVDCGDGTAAALLQNNIDFNSIDSILFTHYHADHFSGIAALITQMKLYRRTGELKLYTHKQLVEPLEKFLKYTYLFKEVLDFDLGIIPFKENDEIYIAHDFSFIPKQNSHVTNKHNIENYDESYFVSSSFMVKNDDIRIIYTSDIGEKGDLFLFNEIEPHLFITETTHIDYAWIIDLFKEVNPREVILTHISDEDETKLKNWFYNLTEEYQERIKIVKDGHIVTLPV